MEGFKLSVLTYNIWDVPFTTARRARMKALGAKLRTSNYDVIALQEAWSPETRELLTKEAGLPYSHTFLAGGDLPGGASGGGLLILSRYPIVNGQFFRFLANGQPYQLHHFDYQAGKGVGYVQIRTPSGLVDVFSTHFIARYNYSSADGYFAHRVAQALQAGNVINMVSRAPLAILMGDLNSASSSMEYQLVTDFTGMSDCYAVTHVGKEGAVEGATCNVIGDPLSEVTAAELPQRAEQANQRLDYVLFRAQGGWKVEACNVQFSEPIVQSGSAWLPCSDHYAVNGVFTCTAVQTPMPATPRLPMPVARRRKLLQSALDVIHAGVRRSSAQRNRNFFFSLFLLFLCGAFQWYMAEHIGLRNIAAGACCAGLACSSTVLSIVLIFHVRHKRIVFAGVAAILLLTLVAVVRCLLHEGLPAVVGMACMVALPVGIAFSTFSFLTDSDELCGMKTMRHTATALLRGVE